jgi:hypothetical protein
VLKICPAHRRRPFRPESQYIAAPVFERIHLLGNDIGAFAYTSGEKLGILKSRGIEALVSVKPAQRDCPVFKISPVALLFRQNIRSTPRRFVQEKVPSLRSYIIADRLGKGIPITDRN